MEDLWKLRDMGYRVNDLGDRAEYDLLLRRFHDEEKVNNMRNLLYGDASLAAGEKDKKPG